MTIIRTAFWLAVVVFLLPSGNSNEKDQEKQVSLNQAVSAASQTAGDMAGFCKRNPDVCVTGKAALHSFGVKAKFGAQKMMEWANSPSNIEGETPETTPSSADTSDITAAIGKQADASSAIASKGDRVIRAGQSLRGQKSRSQGKSRSQNTLTRDDLAPAWKGPKTA